MKSEPQIIWQDSDLVAINKPACWLSVPSRMGRADPRPCLGIWLQERLKTKIFPIHRLDFEVGGLIIFALNQAAERKYSMLFESREIKKTYEAWVVNPLPLGTEMVVENLLVKGKKRAFVAPHGKKSITHLRAIKRFMHEGKELTLVELNPLTGRSHQLRVHLAGLSAPIYGDKLYGGEGDLGGGIALWSKSLLGGGLDLTLPH